MQRPIFQLLAVVLIVATAADAQSAVDDSVLAQIMALKRPVWSPDQVTDSLSVLAGLPRPSRASALSVATTVAPIAIGILIWTAQEKKHVLEYNSDGWLYRDYYKDPDRTLPIVLMFGGVVVGPASGFIYGGRTGRGVQGVVIRMVTGGAFVMVAISGARSAQTDQALDYSGLGTGLIIGSIGAAIVVIESLYDLGKVKDTVRKHNQKLLSKSLSVSPSVTSDGTVGLRLRATF